MKQAPTVPRWRGKFNKLVDEFEREGTLEAQHEPVLWISNAVLAPKEDRGTRMTMNMRNVHKVIKQITVSVPRVENIEVEITGCTVFSKKYFK